MLRTALISLLFFSAAAHAEPLTLGIVLDQNEAISDLSTTQRYRAFARDVEKSVGEPVRVQFYTRGFAAIKGARDGNLDIIYAPAQVIANVGRFKFEPILKTEQTTSAAFVAAPGYNGNLAAKSNAKLGVPDYESLMGGMARSEINSRGLSKADFAEIKFHRMADAPLFGLKIGRYDLAVASAEEAKTWAAANGGRIVFTSAPVPLRALSVQTEKVSPAAQQKLAASLQQGNSLKLAMNASSKADFKGVASMLNTTPTVLPGAKLVTAAEVRDLIAKGTPVYDVRVEEEYEKAHIPGAVSLTYKEASAKEVGFDPGDDQWSVNRLPKDKNAAFIVYCDGTICWRGYKAATMAVKSGYKNVYWFRGGFPEWREAGLSTQSKKN